MVRQGHKQQNQGDIQVENGERETLQRSNSLQIYIHDPANRQHLLVDKRAAEVVRRIFQMTAEGKGVTEIARTLVGEKVLIPSAYFEKYYPESCRNHRYHVIQSIGKANPSKDFTK